MGRNRLFDESEVIDKAVGRFWTHGYTATSIRDLERAMGMTSTSIYNAFGSKKSLFERALQRYLDQSSRRRIALLNTADDPRKAIEEFLNSVVKAGSAGRDGCLLINTAAEMAAHDADIERAVADGLREVEEALARAVRRGQASGSIPRRIAPDDFARTVLGTIVAMQVMARTGAGAAYLQALAESLIATLAEEPRERGPRIPVPASGTPATDKVITNRNERNTS